MGCKMPLAWHLGSPVRAMSGSTLDALDAEPPHGALRPAVPVLQPDSWGTKSHYSTATCTLACTPSYPQPHEQISSSALGLGRPLLCLGATA